MKRLWTLFGPPPRRVRWAFFNRPMFVCVRLGYHYHSARCLRENP